jgi:hypothetical protein
MLLLMSGREGSTGYSFFSVVAVATLGRSANLVVSISAADGDRVASSAVGEETGEEIEFLGAFVATRRTLGKPSRSWSAILASIILGGTEMTSAGRRPDASVASASAPATRSSRTASTAEAEPPEAAQWSAVVPSGPQRRLASTAGSESSRRSAARLP